ncbi:tRNA lysidine(34) synthetase TilS [Jannaschia sp. R86511]|uniref:tRNA lysidine(34) synthetase TilS n=1 Tax=Jannaschia sp. R86511 TaxID=3093853 RepID=UPI0036D279E1
MTGADAGADAGAGAGADSGTGDSGTGDSGTEAAGTSAAVREVQLAVRAALLDLGLLRAPGLIGGVGEVGRVGGPGTVGGDAQVGRAGGPGCVVVGLSGGSDSLALLAATVHVAVPTRLRVHAVVVDHGWRAGSAAVAARVARGARELGADHVRVVRVQAARAPGGGWVGGPEDAARTARHAALVGAAERDGARAVLLGHTLDDQAEQVLLGLARGSGARALAGMPAVRPPFVRPLLRLRRDLVARACPVLPGAGLPWHDPANDDPAYLRSRVRHELLPVLTGVLGEAAATSLARSADLLRDDDEALAGWAAREAHDLLRGGPAGVGDAADGAGPRAVEVPLGPLAALPAAVRTRVLRRLAGAAGAGPLTRRHTVALDDLVVAWRGQGEVSLPGGVRAGRVAGADGCGRLRIAADRTPREDLHGRP